MKVAFESQIIRSEYFDYYSDEELKKYGIYNKEVSLEPIKIKDFYLTINEVGNLILGFESSNYKYLNFEFGKSSNQPIEGDYTNYWTKYLTICSTIKLPWVDEDTKEISHTYHVPLVEFEIVLQPENDWEENLLRGNIVTYSRWTHHVTFVPWIQIEVGYDKDDLIENPEEEMVYEYDLKN